MSEVCAAFTKGSRTSRGAQRDGTLALGSYTKPSSFIIHFTFFFFFVSRHINQSINNPLNTCIFISTYDCVGILTVALVLMASSLLHKLVTVLSCV